MSLRIKQIYKRLAFLSYFSIIFLFSCDKKGVNPVPEVPVNVFVNLNLPAYQNLNNPGGWAYVNGGSRGIIVYRNFNTFVALDRHTTYQPDSTCAIAEVDDENYFIINDPCSDSQYSIIDGTVTQGPAEWGLRPYFTSWDGGKSLQITN